MFIDISLAQVIAWWQAITWTNDGWDLWCHLVSYAPETMSSTDRRTDRRTDGQTDRRTDKVNPVYPPSNFVGRGYKWDLWCHLVSLGHSELNLNKHDSWWHWVTKQIQYIYIVYIYITWLNSYRLMTYSLHHGTRRFLSDKALRLWCTLEALFLS